MLPVPLLEIHQSKMWLLLLALNCLPWWTSGSLIVPMDSLTTEDVTLATDVYEDGNFSTSSPNSPESFATGALSAFTVIIVSEFGDKTFFIAVVLALSHSAICVFGGAISALALMTVLSAGLGLVSSVIPVLWVHFLSAILFLLFGIKMLREGYLMKSDAGKAEFEDVQKTVDSKMSAKSKSYMVSDLEAGTVRNGLKWVFLESFAMTFLAEWGDRSQITTLVLAAKHSVVGVILGAVLGHAACTLLAVAGGRVVADRISLKAVTVFGGLLFLAFAVWSFYGAMEEVL